MIKFKAASVIFLSDVFVAVVVFIYLFSKYLLSIDEMILSKKVVGS